MSLGQIIRKKREQLNFTLDEVSTRVGFSKPYLSTIETGKVKNPPSDELLVKLEKMLEFEPGLLLHIAHMERLPSDIKQQIESAQAETDTEAASAAVAEPVAVEDEPVDSEAASTSDETVSEDKAEK